MFPNNIDKKKDDKSNFKYFILGSVIFIFLWFVITVVEVVGTGYIGVVTQYGRVTGKELSEGISVIAPFGINKVTKYNIKTQKVEAQSNAATKDLQDVNAKVVLNYYVNRGKVSEIHQKVGRDFQAIEIDPQVQEAFKAVSARYTASELITSRAEVKQAVLENLRERVEKDKRYTIVDIAITDFQFSAAFNQAIESVQIANQNIAKARQELETTKVEAEKRITEATAAAESQRLQLQTLTDELLMKQWIEKWDGKLPTTVTGDSTLISLPIK